jgi:DNA/RNA-binding domain of Phe-tRNA-synthetase-like protein
MHISIEDTIITKYPNIEIGYLIAHVKIKNSHPFVENLKTTLSGNLKELGINATNFVAHPNLSVWRKIYKEDFQVKETTYRSSIEALLRRIVTGKELWNICNVVDLYNCCSILSLLPMGGYDLAKISGDIKIRYAKEGESFQGIGEKVKIEAQSHHVVYADNQRLICWLWNHKDAQETCIDGDTKQVIFFIDSVNTTKPNAVQEALTQLSGNLEKIESVPISYGILNSRSPQITLPNQVY